MESEKSISSNSYTHISVHLGHQKVVTIKTLNTGHGILSMTSHTDHTTTGLETYHGKQKNKTKKRTQNSDLIWISYRINMVMLQERRQVKLLLFQKSKQKQL